MKRSKFFFKQSYLEAANLFSDPVLRAEFIMAVTQYGIDGTTYQGDSEVIRIAMTLIMPQIDSENRRYAIVDDQACRVATCRDRQKNDNDIQQQCTVATACSVDCRVTTCRDRENIDCKDKTAHRDFRRWIKLNAPNVYQRLCRKISNRDLAAICDRYDLRQLHRKILLLEHNGKKVLQCDTLAIALQRLDDIAA